MSRIRGRSVCDEIVGQFGRGFNPCLKAKVLCKRTNEFFSYVSDF